MISLYAFIVGYLALIFIGRIGVELYGYFEDKRERKKDLLGAATLNKSANKSVQRYYSMKDARTHTYHRKGA